MDRDERMALLDRLQDGFNLIRAEREAQQKKFESESSVSFSRIKSMANEGLKLAAETHEYKETREYLKIYDPGSPLTIALARDGLEMIL